MSNAILEQLRTNPGLPAPTGIALRVLELARNENSTLEEIARTVVQRGDLDLAVQATATQGPSRRSGHGPE